MTRSTRSVELSSSGGSLEISDREFNAFRQLIYEAIGISLSPNKRALVCSRLSKRLRELQMDSFSAYYEHVVAEGPGSDEHQSLINCITTNKTNFFREPHHFDFLRDEFLPRLKERAAAGHPRRLRVWSAGCSTGEEPYTIAMTVLQFLGKQAAQWDARILASDIDTDVLAKARAGQYSNDLFEGVSEDLKRKYFLRGTGAASGDCRVRPELQRLITFRQVNLIENPWPIHAQFDLIFCRNVLIYFDRPTQNTIVSRMSGMLAENGVLFLGHSENADWAASDLVSQGNTIYRRRAPNARRSTDQAGAEASKGPQTARISVPGTAGTDRLQSLSARLQPGGNRSKAAKPMGATGATAARSLQLDGGGMQASSTPLQVGAVLGSSVAVCLFDAGSGVGGMCQLVSDGDSMTVLMEELVRLGAAHTRLQAKLFGGKTSGDPALSGVGDQNIRRARAFLLEQGIPLVAERVGGPRAMEVRFLTDTGKALVRMLEENEPHAALEREAEQLRDLPDHRPDPWLPDPSRLITNRSPNSTPRPTHGTHQSSGG